MSALAALWDIMEYLLFRAGLGAAWQVRRGSYQSLDLYIWASGGHAAENLFQSFLREAVMSNSGMIRDVHFFTLSIQLFPFRPWRRHAPPKTP